MFVDFIKHLFVTGLNPKLLKWSTQNKIYQSFTTKNIMNLEKYCQSVHLFNRPLMAIIRADFHESLHCLRFR